MFMNNIKKMNGLLLVYEEYCGAFLGRTSYYEYYFFGHSNLTKAYLLHKRINIQRERTEIKTTSNASDEKVPSGNMT